MGVNNVGNSGSSAYVYGSDKYKQSKAAKTGTEQTQAGTVTEDTVELGASSASKTYKPDQAQLKKLWAQVNASSQPLRDMVEKLLTQARDTAAHGANIGKAADGGKTLDLASLLGIKSQGGKFELKVDSETQAWAKEQISDEGFWGAPQTSQRLIDFAAALSGGDPAKADALMAAVEKGFNQAAKMFGGWDNLPDVTKRTFDLVKDGFAKWKETGTPPTASASESDAE